MVRGGAREKEDVEESGRVSLVASEAVGGKSEEEEVVFGRVGAIGGWAAVR